MTAFKPRLPHSARHAGFTVPELLLASVLGAMLLGSLAFTTYGYTRNLDHMEEEAGISGKDADPALRRITNDIRQAWWVEQVSTNHIKLADTSGAYTEYYTSGSNLVVKRPNGDTGVLYENFKKIIMDPTYTDRFREGAPASHDGIWYSTLDAAGTTGTLTVGSGESLAIGFAAPALPTQVPGQAASEEQLLSVQSSIFDLPMAFDEGSGEKKVTLTLYEGWAPGRGRPTGTSLASVTLNGSSIPEANKSSGVWDIPSEVLPVSLSAALTPGVGYTLVITPLGNSNTVVFKQKLQTTFPADQILKKGTGGSAPWVSQMSVIPLEVKGPWTLSTTTVTPVITRVSITIIPMKRPLQQRSAVILSQGVSDDPWLGVVPGEAAP